MKEVLLLHIKSVLLLLFGILACSGTLLLLIAGGLLGFLVEVEPEIRTRPSHTVAGIVTYTEVGDRTVALTVQVLLLLVLLDVGEIKLDLLFVFLMGTELSAYLEDLLGDITLELVL